MTVTREINNIYDFEFYGPAKQFVKLLTWQEKDLIWSTLEEIIDHPIDESELNDIFAYYNDKLCIWIHYTGFEELYKERRDYEYGFMCTHLQRI